MLKQDRIAEFITTLITYADDEDIKTFLGYCANNLPKRQFEYSNQKTLLIGYLFQYIYGHIETKAREIVDIVSKWDNHLFPEHIDYPKNLFHYEPLYLHLYALCECFYSYKMINQSQKTFIQKLKTINNPLTKNIECPTSVKNNSATKLLKLLINSYKENGFYYFFYDDTLVKLTIHRCNKPLDNEQAEEDEGECIYPSVRYEYTKYKLEDRENKTYITDGKNINKSLGSYLIRTRYVNVYIENKTSLLDNIENCIKASLQASDYNKAKTLHKKIIAILKEIPSKKPRKDKLCTEKNLNKLQEIYEVILCKLQKSQSLIIDDEPEEIIRDFKDIDFEKELFANYTDFTISELHIRNKQYLEKTLTKLLQCIKKADDDHIYSNLEYMLFDVQDSIEQYLDILL